MDFHHIDPEAKDFTIADNMTSWERILPELAKCVLLCARCHREVHEGWHPNLLAREGLRYGDTESASIQLDLLR